MNELLILLSIFLLYGLVVAFSRLLGREGLFAWVSIATLLANIEVLILVRAFGMEQTLGNVLFASTFLATDVISELYGKESAKKAANIGIATSFTFFLMTVLWQIIEPSANDLSYVHLSALFKTAPRVLAASLISYTIVERFDVWAYHAIWEKTAKRTGDKSSFLWLRNNLATITSQFINAVLYTFLAFYKTYDNQTLLSIVSSSLVIFLATSLLDTPFLYLAKEINLLQKS